MHETWRVVLATGEVREVAVESHKDDWGDNHEVRYFARWVKRFASGDASRDAIVRLASDRRGVDGWPVAEILAPGEPTRAELVAQLAAVTAERDAARVAAMEECAARCERAADGEAGLAECDRRDGDMRHAEIFSGRASALRQMVRAIRREAKGGDRATMRDPIAEVRHLTDDPTKDDSDEAHPAWWRGYNAIKGELARAVDVAHAEARSACARVALLEAERDEARTKLHAAETELAHLRESLRVATPEDRMIDSLDAMPFTPDAYMDWIRAHPAEMAQHAGRYVAIHADRGIIAVGDDPVMVVHEHGNTEGDLMVTFVSPVMVVHEHGNTEGDLMVTFVSPILDAAPGEADAPDCQVRRGVPSKSGGA